LAGGLGHALESVLQVAPINKQKITISKIKKEYTKKHKQTKRDIMLSLLEWSETVLY
jgi:hypothetical protein